MNRLLAIVLTLGGLPAWAEEWVAPEHGLCEVPHNCVHLDGGFWGPRQAIHHETTIPHVLDKLEEAGHMTNFDKAAGNYEGELKGHHAFDSDLHKAMEGAMYVLQHVEDPELRKQVESILDRILAAQQEDGFLISYFIVKDPGKRWEDLRTQHQMYNAGHFFELAVEHERLTGNPRAVDAAKRFADHIGGIFGPGKRYDVGGHEEIELALIKLYRATGERRYLDLCRFLLDERGHAHGNERKPFVPGPPVVPERQEGQTDKEYARAKWRARLYVRNGRMQDHKPLVDQDEAVGHAVRAGYIYSAMADIARFSEAPEYRAAVKTLWEDVVGRKMYLTGGLGTAQYGDEGFGDPYLLPNKTYCESCAAIAHVFWQHRMNLLEGDAKYADVMELTLYNGALSGMALSGDAFFYQNPLESANGAARSPWIGLACCPTNLARFTPQVGGYVYAQSGDDLYVNLFAQGRGKTTLEGGTAVTLEQETNYPWDGKVKLSMGLEKEATFTLALRIPGWVRAKPVPSDLYTVASGDPSKFSVTINGKPVDANSEDGYVRLERAWQDGDEVKLDLPMPVRRVLAHPNIEANRGKMALMRGPVVYCLEAADNPGVDVLEVHVPDDLQVVASFREDLLGGVRVLVASWTDGEGHPRTLTFVPYHAWANREKGAMTVWVKRAGQG